MTSPRSTKGAEGRGYSKVRRDLVMSRLLDQATHLFAERGYEATSLQDIADSMEMSRPALYHYISSKEDLLRLLVQKASRSIADSIDAIGQQPGLSATDRLRAIVQVLLRERAGSLGQLMILDRSDAFLPADLREDHVNARRSIVSQITAVINHGIEAGEFKRVDARIATFGILGMCNWVAWWCRPERGFDADQVVTQLSDAALDSLRASDAIHSPAATIQVGRVQQELDALAALLRVDD